MQLSTFKKYMVIDKNTINLDVGCGDGWISRNIDIPKTSTLYMVDRSVPEQIDSLGRKFIRADISTLPFSTSSIHSVLLSSVLQVVPFPEKLLVEINRVLITGGQIILSVPVGYPVIAKLLSYSRVRRICSHIKKKDVTYNAFKEDTSKLYNIEGVGFFSILELEKILTRCGFNIISIENSPKIFGSLLFQSLIFIRYLASRKKMTSKFDNILYLLLFFDRFFPIERNRIEVIVKVCKKV